MAPILNSLNHMPYIKRILYFIYVYIFGIFFVYLHVTIVELKTGVSYEIEISPVNKHDYKSITKSRFWFNWKEEVKYDIYKLQIKDTDEILGLVSLESFSNESRIEIRLLAVSKENRGKSKEYDHVAGNLIAFAAIQSIKLFGEWGCISLVPKTRLIKHYMKKYYMLQAGKSLFLDGNDLIQLILKYDHD